MSELPRGWTQATIQDCASPEAGAFTDGPYGSNLKTSHYTATGPRVIRLGNITAGALDMSDEAHVEQGHFDSLERHHVRPGDVVIAALGDPIGRACRVPEDIGPAMVKADCFRLRPGDHVDADYLVNWFNCVDAREAFLAASHGMGRIRVNLSDVRASPIPLAPFPEQRRIVAKLDRLSARSRAARDHLARTAKLAARSKQAILAAAFHEASEGAEWSSLGEVASHITSGSRDWSRYYDRGEAVFVLAANVRPMAFDPTPRRLVDPPRDGADAKRTLLAKDDLLITIVGANAGDICRVSADVKDYFVCQSVALARCSESWRSRFVELFLNSEMTGGEQVRQAIYGQGRPHLSFDDLKAFSIPVLDQIGTEAVVRRIEAAFARIDRLTAEAARAAHLLDRLDERLLAKAFRGELVSQDPADEPAEALLARIRAARDETARPRRRRRAGAAT